MSYLPDNLILIDARTPCASTRQAAMKLAQAGYRIGMVGQFEPVPGLDFLSLDPGHPLPDGVVACLSANASWIEQACQDVPHLVLLGAPAKSPARSYPSALSWADDYLAPRVPRINRSLP